MHNGLSIYQILQDHISCLTMPILHTVQSSNRGQNSIITPEVETNPLLLQNCN